MWQLMGFDGDSDADQVLASLTPERVAQAKALRTRAELSFSLIEKLMTSYQMHAT